MHFFSFPANFEEFASEALSQDFLDLRRGLYKMVSFNQKFRALFKMYLICFPEDVSCKIKEKEKNP